VKCIQRLSSVTLLSCLTYVSCGTFNSAVAMSKGTEDVPIQTSSTQAMPVTIAQLKLPSVIRDATRTVNQLEQIRAQQRRRAELLRRRQEWEAKREERKAEILRRQQELEVARREATEQQRLEAERRQQYFESLSPEQKEAYLAEQRARREQADKAASLLLMMLFAGGSGSASNSGDDEIRCSYSPNTFNNGNRFYETARMSRRRCLEMGGDVL
jgi:HD superfamily phosphohydrolase